MRDKNTIKYKITTENNVFCCTSVVRKFNNPLQRNASSLKALSRCQTINKVGQLLGHGVVSKDNRPMKCTTSKLLTCRVTNGGPVWSAFYVVWQSKIKQYKSVGVLVVCHFFDVTRHKWQVARVMVQRFHRPIVFGN